MNSVEEITITVSFRKKDAISTRLGVTKIIHGTPGTHNTQLKIQHEVQQIMDELITQRLEELHGLNR